VASLMVTRPPPNDRTAREDSKGGVVLLFRSPEDCVLECEYGGGAWAAHQRTPVAHESVWWLQ
jgi:hypothetical protein